MTSPMTPRQRRLARHALGLPNSRRLSYRNRFFPLLSADKANWDKMCQGGLANAHKTADGTTWFSLTFVGANHACEPNETLCREDFPFKGRAQPMPAAEAV